MNCIHVTIQIILKRERPKNRFAKFPAFSLSKYVLGMYSATFPCSRTKKYGTYMYLYPIDHECKVPLSPALKESIDAFSLPK